jgi:hypothetical protein
MITPAGSATHDETPPGASPPQPREADQPSAPIEHLIHVIPDISTRAYLLLLGAAILLGTIVRASHVLLSDFPLNDGGMFYAMARDLQQHGFTIPATTSYNSADIPFAYPPLGFYLVALLDRVTPGSLLEMFRVLPLLYSAATLIAFAMLAHRIVKQQAAVIGATVAFALIPRSFLWLIMGGGVARGLGLTFALFALHEAHRLYTERNTSEGDAVGRPEPRYILTTGIAFAGCVLSHVETGWFLGFSIVIFWLAYGRTRRTFVYSIAIAALGLALTAPWWATVALQHGLRPFIEANASGGNFLSSRALAWETLLSLARITSTSEPFFPLIGAIALLGGLAALRARHFVLPLWWVAIILLDLRAFPTFTTIPVALLAGMGVAQIVLPLAHLVWDRPLLREPIEDQPLEHHDDQHNNGHDARTGAALAPWQRVSRGAVLLTIGLLLYSTVGALLRAPGFAGEAAYLVGLTHDERNAMQWIKTNTTDDARILIVPRGPWQVDKEAEWFPVIADRVSVGTVQGTEWTHSFEEHVRAFDHLWQCGYQLSDCLSSWSLDTGTTFTHVWVPRTQQGQCCGTLVASLRDANAYRVVYDGPGGTVFTYRAVPPSSLASSVPLFSPVAATR